MNLKKFITKEITIKLIISILILILFSLAFLFEENLKQNLYLTVALNKNEISASELSNYDYQVNFLDVGQGNCTVVKLPDQKVVMIDGGSAMYGEKIYKFLVKNNIYKIDYLIITHADADHIGGLNYLFDKIEFVNIFRPMQIAGSYETVVDENENIISKFKPSEYEDLKDVYKLIGSSKFIEVTSETYLSLIKNIYLETYSEGENQKFSNVSVFYDGLKIEGENYNLEFFAPLIADENINFLNYSRTGGYLTKIYNNDSSNNSSSIFVLEINGDSYFISGDASAPKTDDEKLISFEETDFVLSLTPEEIERLNIDVYLVAHHGSKFSSSDMLIDLLRPEFAVISVGERNDYGHPTDEAIERLKSSASFEDDGLLRTDEFGTITFVSKNGNIVYVLESTTNQDDLIIPYWLLALTLFVFIEILMWGIKIKKENV